MEIARIHLTEALPSFALRADTTGDGEQDKELAEEPELLSPVRQEEHLWSADASGMRPKGSAEELEPRRRAMSLLEEEGHSQAEAARMVGSSRSSVCRWRRA